MTWIRCRNLLDAEMETHILPHFSLNSVQYWRRARIPEISYLSREKKPTFSACVQYPGELCAVVFICWDGKERYGDVFTRERLSALEGILNSIGAPFG